MTYVKCTTRYIIVFLNIICITVGDEIIYWLFHSIGGFIFLGFYDWNHPVPVYPLITRLAGNALIRPTRAENELKSCIYICVRAQGIAAERIRTSRRRVLLYVIYSRVVLFTTPFLLVSTTARSADTVR